MSRSSRQEQSAGVGLKFVGQMTAGGADIPLAGPSRSQGRPGIGRGDRDVSRVRGAPRCIGAPPAIEYGTVAIVATEKARTAKSARRPASWSHTAGRPKAMGRRAAVRATCSRVLLCERFNSCYKWELSGVRGQGDREESARC